MATFFFKFIHIKGIVKLFRGASFERCSGRSESLAQFAGTVVVQRGVVWPSENYARTDTLSPSIPPDFVGQIWSSERQTTPIYANSTSIK